MPADVRERGPMRHAIVITHTDRHLERVLWGVACQSPRPETLTVSCDVEKDAIREAVARAAGRMAGAGRGMVVRLVMREHQGVSRSSQVRNNAVRALRGVGMLADRDALWFLDGDCCPHPRCMSEHMLWLGGGLSLGFRHDLTEEQTLAFSEGELETGGCPIRVTPDQERGLAARERRYRRQALLRRLGLGKAHKPKLLSANFAVEAGLYAAIDGFDESYEGYGQEDDDLARRLYRAGARPGIAVLSAVAYHLHHPTRAPEAWHRSPNAARFARPYRIRPELGLSRPAAQPEPRVEVVEPVAV